MKKIDQIIKNYTQIFTITEEEYNAAQKELPQTEFEHLYLAYKEYGKDVYKTRVIPTSREIDHLMAYEIVENVRTIKGCVVFFAVLTAVSLVISIASMVVASSAL